ncbi:MAG: hypothetical protein GEU89_18970 [Kiloniellaceae bacterium]|nr:hypothetical protein [Kiloniellaceae bacterium]
MAQTSRPTTTAVGQKSATKYTGPLRCRMAHRIIIRLAIVIFVMSMISGQSAILDALAITALLAAITSVLFFKF